jgi:hypothetical protein
MTAVIGCDPGSTSGAVVLRLRERVLGWWVWSRVAGGLRVRGVAPGAGVVVHTVSAQVPNERPMPAFYVGKAAMLVRRDCPALPLVLEGLYVEPHRRGRKVNPQSTIPLAESAGAIDAILGPAIARPLFAEWTTRLGVRDTAHAVELAGGRERVVDGRLVRDGGLVWPAPGWSMLRGLTQDELGAVCEAAIIASWPVENALQAHP